MVNKKLKELAEGYEKFGEKEKKRGAKGRAKQKKKK
jgi:hypothetical protein